MKPFHLPNLLMSAPMRIEAPIWPTIMGIVMRPDSVGEAPRASWKYCARNTLVANIATPIETEAITASVKVRFLKSVIGTIGSGTKNSVMMKPMMAAARDADHDVAGHRVPLELAAAERHPDEQQ